MKLITLEKVLWALQDMKYEVDLPSEIISKSQRSIQRMLEFADKK
jgi:quinolinate synthase